MQNLEHSGLQKIAWARSYMPLLGMLQQEFGTTKPLLGKTIAMSIHMEAKTAVLAQTLRIAGAQVRATGCNPLSTQDDVAAALNLTDGIEVFAKYACDQDEYEHHLTQALGDGVDAFIDDGGDFVHLLHGKLRHLLPKILGGCEETTTGVMRLKSRHHAGKLDLAMIAVNDSRCKYLFDNRYGTGQSVWDGILRTTNVSIPGRVVVIAGYGYCGKGIAMRARALGARVIVTEIDPVKAIEAVMDGYESMPMQRACAFGDIFITATGCKQVISQDHFLLMKHGAILCNAGHFDVEVDVASLSNMATSQKESRKNIQSFTLQNGNTLHVLGQGRLVNLACADGHPIEVMDLSFCLQALSVVYMASGALEDQKGIFSVPQEIDDRAAQMKLSCVGGGCDVLTKGQAEYLAGWET